MIPLHPGFRMLVLANRPGFPFLGEDFYREVGDVFAVQAFLDRGADKDAANIHGRTALAKAAGEQASVPRCPFASIKSAKSQSGSSVGQRQLVSAHAPPGHG